MSESADWMMLLFVMRSGRPWAEERGEEEAVL